MGVEVQVSVLLLHDFINVCMQAGYSNIPYKTLGNPPNNNK